MSEERKPAGSGRATVLLCLAGLVVAGVGLAYCVHLGATESSRNAAATRSPAEIKMLTSADGSSTALTETAGAVSGVDSAKSKMLLGTVRSLTATDIRVQMSDGREHLVTLNAQTHYESVHGAGREGIRVGDLVVVHVLQQGQTMVADLIIDGRVTASQPGN
ncbi:hypothetical protein [Williamsia sterculiae]|uniref:DUF5666 domain-containing protein n=1 Tax=Williamsia sterculiae TaxID=1344003 RepID=A0A1N7CP74_9NOCA|nr:hypothetical protein [Williamsia sterculiae]SIR65287.1 hypothetical protein SAMN05445060_0261 [Williamsia sterculiae]